MDDNADDVDVHERAKVPKNTTPAVSTGGPTRESRKAKNEKRRRGEGDSKKIDELMRTRSKYAEKKKQEKQEMENKNNQEKRTR